MLLGYVAQSTPALVAALIAALPPRPAPSTVRQVAGWITGLPGRLDPADAVHACDPGALSELDAAVRHVAGFARMIKDLSGDNDKLTVWMGAVDADLPVLRSFTAGLRRDLDAVVAVLTLEYNSGAVEGPVNRIKQLKAAMYGRAKPDLLPMHVAKVDLAVSAGHRRGMTRVTGVTAVICVVRKRRMNRHEGGDGNALHTPKE